MNKKTDSVEAYIILLSILIHSYYVLNNPVRLRANEAVALTINSLLSYGNIVYNNKFINDQQLVLQVAGQLVSNSPLIEGTWQ